MNPQYIEINALSKDAFGVTVTSHNGLHTSSNLNFLSDSKLFSDHLHTNWEVSLINILPAQIQSCNCLSVKCSNSVCFSYGALPVNVPLRDQSQCGLNLNTTFNIKFVTLVT